jgi:excisionase family DNA binding protein
LRSFFTKPTTAVERSRATLPQESPPEWMSLATLTRYADVSERTLREWLHRAVNPLPASRVGGKILVARAKFDAWLAAQPLVPAEAVNVDAIAEEILSRVGAAD